MAVSICRSLHQGASSWTAFWNTVFRPGVKYQFLSFFKFQISFIRRRDFHILSNGHSVYTNDQRIEIFHAAKSHDWYLVIKQANHNDSGIYECQVKIKYYRTYYCLLDEFCHILVSVLLIMDFWPNSGWFPYWGIGLFKIFPFSRFSGIPLILWWNWAILKNVFAIS